jgi:hypothetical protein
VTDIKFDYQLRNLGWAFATVRYDGQELQLHASYLTHALDDLLYALVRLAQGHRYAAVSWDAEPTEYRWVMHRHNDDVDVAIMTGPGRLPGRPDDAGTRVFNARWRLTDLVAAIAAGARRLLTELGEDRYAEQWDAGPFPRMELEALEKWLQAAHPAVPAQRQAALPDLVHRREP